MATVLAGGGWWLTRPEPGAPAIVRRAPPSPIDGPTDVPGVDRLVERLGALRPSPPRKAEEFAVPAPDGRTIRLSDHRGRVVFLNFWATWCPPCREEMPAMERLFRETRAEGLVMLAVSVDADPAVVVPFIEEHRLTFMVAIDRTMEVADRYGVRGLPATFIVDRQGFLAAVALGPRSWDSPDSVALVRALARR